MNAAAIGIAVFAAVLTAELLGDKLLFTIASLGARYRPAAIFGGLVPAQMTKMAAAVLAGDFIARLPATVVTLVSVLTFALTAVVIWRARPDDSGPAGGIARGESRHGAALAFSTVLLTEWGDAGQLAAIAMAAQYREPWIVWAAATAALTTKGLIALSLGGALQSRVPAPVLRVSGTSVCVLMAVLSALAVD
jgi:putative Ca2+/H+ antiporter (TMEM165/GDT1 family)